MAALAQTTATLLAFPRGVSAPHGVLTTALKQHRLPDLLIETLVREAAQWPDVSPHQALACALGRRMKPAGIDFEKARGILLVGPMGAGKSAVAEKIIRAATLAGRAPHFARAADGLPLFRSGTHPADRLTVMEADGFNPVNIRARNAFAALSAIEGVDSIGVVSALSDAQDIADMVGALRFSRVIVTGLDRTRRLGALVAAATGGARLTYVTQGPRADDALETLNADALASMLLDA
jgi:flagellar biosynthesis protein FlhF